MFEGEAGEAAGEDHGDTLDDGAVPETGATAETVDGDDGDEGQSADVENMYYKAKCTSDMTFTRWTT